MITYVVNEVAEGLSIKIPKLHTVTFNDLESFTAALHWLASNRLGAIYRSPAWHDRPFIQFEDDEDAAMVALKFL